MNFDFSLVFGVAAFVVTIVNVYIMFFLKRAFNQKDEERKDLKTELENLAISIKEINTVGTKLDKSIAILETNFVNNQKEMEQFKHVIGELKDFKFKTQKAYDSANRAHQRLDRVEEEIHRQEKLIIKLTPESS